MAEVKTYAEVGGDGACLLYTFDPPGLLVRAECLERGLAEAPAAARRLRAWLAQGGLVGLLAEGWAEGETPQVAVAEMVRRRGPVGNGNTRATFQRDLVQLSPPELVAGIAVLGHLRSELWALKAELPDGAYPYRSLPHRMTIAEQLNHMADCDRWYLSRFWADLPRLPRSTDVWQKLALNRDRALSVLSGMTPADMRRQVTVDSQVWTARKVVRRCMYHERFHLDTIRRDLELYGAAGA
ncbi:MAG: DinB family protein [Bacillota bacterium]